MPAPSMSQLLEPSTLPSLQLCPQETLPTPSPHSCLWPSLATSPAPAQRGNLRPCPCQAPSLGGAGWLPWQGPADGTRYPARGAHISWARSRLPCPCIVSPVPWAPAPASLKPHGPGYYFAPRIAVYSCTAGEPGMGRWPVFSLWSLLGEQPRKLPGNERSGSEASSQGRHTCAHADTTDPADMSPTVTCLPSWGQGQ